MREKEKRLQSYISKNDVVVVIPTYKKDLSDFEEISLQQINRTLNGYNKVFIAPTKLEFEYGNQYAAYMVERFNDKYFDSVSGYNELMLSEEFYIRFSKYKYILIAQLDAFIFSDRLLYFCNLGYDYIGAPWIHGIRYYKDVYNIIHYVGNGGLSLRKVESFIEWLSKGKSSFESYIGEINEDVLIASYGKEYLRIASFNHALQFSFDFDPQESYLRNNSELPFGIHAWFRYDIDFCRPFIEKAGYKVQQYDTEQIKKEYDYRYSYEEKRNLYLKGIVDLGRDLIGKFTDDNNGNLFLWGTGLWGELVGRIFNDLDIEYRGFVDNQKRTDELLGHPVFSSDVYLKEFSGRFKVLIAVFNSAGIRNQLDEIGFVHKKDYLTLDDFCDEVENM